VAVDAAVIQTDGGGGGFSVPNWRILAIGGGAVAALVVVLIQSRKPVSNGQAESSAGALGTSANVALGQIAFDQTRIAGEQGVAMAKLSDALTGGISSILANQEKNQGALLGSLAGLSQEGLDTRNQLWKGILGLSEQGTNQNDQQRALIKSLSWQILASYDPASAKIWLDKWNQEYQTVGTDQGSLTGASKGTGQTSANPSPVIRETVSEHA